MCILCQGVYVCIFMCVFLSVRVYMQLFVSIECAHDTVADYMYLWIRHRYITCNAGLCLREQKDISHLPIPSPKKNIYEKQKTVCTGKNSLIAFVFFVIESHIFIYFWSSKNILIIPPHPILDTPF